MKKIVSFIIAIMLCMTACGTTNLNSDSESSAISKSSSVNEQMDDRESAVSEDNIERYEHTEDETIAAENLDINSDEFQQYFRDRIYAETLEQLDSDQYCIDNIQTAFYSKEYIEQLEYNSQENIYFGFTQSQLDNEFSDEKYVFSFDEASGNTIVKPVETYTGDTAEKVVKNVAIGSGVLLVCVTVSILTAGTSTAVSAILAVGAEKGATLALSGAAFGGITSGIVKGYQTGNFKDALKAGAEGASEGFKWGAITGTLSGGASEAWGLHKATVNGLTMNDVASIQKDSGFPIDLISQFKSMDEYNIYKNAGLRTQMVNGKLALVRDIDLDYKVELPDGTFETNLERMLEGRAPIDPVTGKSYQLHHINQDPNGTLAILTEKEHQGNVSILNNPDITESKINRSEFDTIRKKFWEDLGKQLSANM